MRKSLEISWRPCVAAQQECETLGIQGGSVRSELVVLGRQLPSIYREAVQDLQSPSIAGAMQHYADLVSHTGGADQAPVRAEDVLPTLHRCMHAEVADEASTPQAGAVPEGGASDSALSSRTQHQGLSVSAGGDEDHAAQSSQSAADQQSGPPMEISWDIGLVEAPAEAAPEAGVGAAIDWDIDVAPASDAGTATSAGHTDWDVEVDGAAEPAAKRHAVDPTLVPAAGAYDEHCCISPDALLF